MPIMKYIITALEKGIGFRDDSANVAWYKTLGFGPSCIRTPELYSKVYKTIPVVLESGSLRGSSGDVEQRFWS